MSYSATRRTSGSVRTGTYRIARSKSRPSTKPEFDEPCAKGAGVGRSDFLRRRIEHTYERSATRHLRGNRLRPRDTHPANQRDEFASFDPTFRRTCGN